ncbi:MAG: TonB-dependent receptor, partial [Woeseia sp.]
MNTIKSVAGKCCLFAAATFFVPLANAQETLIEEILVTAQKREQNIQDVPVAVTAYSGRMLEESGIKDITELASVAPSLNANQSQNSTTSSFSIRGIGTSSQNFGLESSVGLYIDNVYRGRQSAIINNLVDIAAVEVLRGPQGTLFGKNTPSGAINMTTVRAGHDRNAFAEVTAGEYGLLNLAAATNVSLIDDVLAMRATVYSGVRDGYVSDLNLGSDKINDRDRAGARLQFYYTPNDDLDIRVVADYGQINETCCAALTRQNNFNAFGRTGPGGAPIFGSDAVLFQLGGTVFQGERPSPVLQQARGGVTLQGDRFEDLTTALNFLPHSSNNDSGVSVELNYDLEGVTLTAISGYREFDSFDLIDADFSNVDLLTDTNAASQRQFSQELRLTGEVGERVTYVGGAYYFEQHLRNTSTLDLGVGTNPFLTQDPALAPAIAGINMFAGNGPFLATANAFPDSSFATDSMTQDHSSFALFAQADFELTETWLLTAGLRYTDEKKTLDGSFLNSPLGPPPDFVEIGTIFALIQAGMFNPFDPANVPRMYAAFAPTYVPGWGLYTQPSLAPQGPLQRELLDDQLTGTIKLSWFATDTTMI